jgi:hypothetical protein
LLKQPAQRPDANDDSGQKLASAASMEVTRE